MIVIVPLDPLLWDFLIIHDIGKERRNFHINGGIIYEENDK